MDIHFLIEIKDSLEGWFKALPECYENNEDGLISPNFNNKFYIKQNYDLFAMLANLKNDGEIDPIIDPSSLGGLRGIPVDASDIYIKLVKQWKGHSHQYYYLRDLKNIERQKYWEKKTIDGILYSSLVPEFMEFYENLKLLETEKKICHNCIRFCFFFTD